MTGLDDDLRRILHDRADGDYLTGSDDMLGRVHTGAKRLHRRRVGSAVLGSLAIVVAGAGVALGGGNLMNSNPDVVAPTTMTPTATVATSGTTTAPPTQPSQPNSTDSASPPVGGGTRTTSTEPTSTADSSRPPAQRQGPVITGFEPRSVRPSGSGKLWVLGRGSCDGKECSPILVSSDGGRSFALDSVVPADVHTLGTDGASYRWVYGTSGFLDSSDSGKTWTRRPKPSPGWVSQTFNDGGTPAFFLRDASRNQLWQGGGIPYFYRLNEPLDRIDDRARQAMTVVSGDKGGTIAVTVSNSNHQPRPTGCKTDPKTPSKVGTYGSTVWLWCPAGSTASVLLSTDRGLHWKTVATGLPAYPTTNVAASGSALVIGMHSGWGLRIVSTSGSVREVKVPGLLQADNLHFQTGSVGYLSSDGIYRTTDGGSSWTKLSFRDFQ